MIKKIYFLFYLLFFVSEIGFSENSLKTNDHLSILNGLSHNGVTSIFTDSQGLIWIGTYDGLNCYNGYNIKKYRNNLPGDYLLSNRVRSINEDNNRNLWIGTDDGISILNLKNDKIKTLYSFKPERKHGPIINEIIFQNNRTLCLSEDQGIIEFDNKNEIKRTHRAVNNEDIKYYDIEQITNDTFIISTTTGLFLFNISQASFTPILPEFITTSASCTYYDNSTFYAATNNFGVMEIEIIDENNFQINDRHYKGIRMRSVNFDKSTSTMWFGSQNKGVYQINKFSNQKSIDEVDIFRFNSSEKQIKTSFILPNLYGGCWIGTFNDGVYRLNTKPSVFKAAKIDIENRNSVQSKDILSLTAYDNESVLLVANVGGAGLFNTRLSEFAPLPFNQSFLIDKTSAILKDSLGYIWIGTSSFGLYCAKPNSNEPFHIDSEKISKFNNCYISALSTDKNGDLWVATSDEIYRIQFDKKREVKNIERLSRNPSIDTKDPSKFVFIYPDPLYNNIWIGTEASGLYQLKTTPGKNLIDIECINYIPGNGVQSITSSFVTSAQRLPDSTLWISTEQGGICQLINETHNAAFIPFTERDGLSNNVVKSMQFDASNKLWISTNNGLDVFNPKTNDFRNFKSEDGLPFLVFQTSSAKLDNGNMVVGSIDGLIYFNPGEIQEESSAPSLYFDNFKLFNKPINAEDTINGRVILANNLSLINEITLKHNENVFSFDALSLHFQNPKNHKIQYRLLPLHENWIVKTSDNKNISYGGLTPNEYILEVKVSNNHNRWSETKQLNINIKPPFWRTSWAYVIYLVLGFISIYLMIYVVLRFSRLRHNLHIEQIEKEREKELNEEKLSYFINVSHELRTPLTLISAPVENILSSYELDNVLKNNLNMVRRQANKMIQLVEQTHDFRRSDKNKLDLHLSKVNFTELIKNKIGDFEYLAENENKTLTIASENKAQFVIADENKLEIVINNIINNAFKFTEQNDEIIIEHRIKKNNLICSISDSGQGVSNDDLPFIFDRFYQSKGTQNFKQGSGIGLAFSKRIIELHKGKIWVENNIGTKFLFEIPVGDLSEYDDPVMQVEDLISEETKLSNASAIVKRKMDIAGINIDEEFKNTLLYVVEDSHELREFLKNTLGQYFNIIAFENGQKCIDALQNEWPELILSDILMPEINGIELCDFIKSDMKTCHIPVILLTAVPAIDKKLEGLGLGADAYINKPFLIEHLIVQITTLLKNRQVLRERFQIDFPHSLEKKQINEKDNQFLEQLYEKINENLDNFELDMVILSKEMGINRTDFFQKIKSLTNQTPYELLKAYRLKRAAEFLINEKMNVSEVYVSTGFKSRTHFSKVFKEQYGISPGKYGK